MTVDLRIGSAARRSKNGWRTATSGKPTRRRDTRPLAFSLTDAALNYLSKPCGFRFICHKDMPPNEVHVVQNGPLPSQVDPDQIIVQTRMA